MNLGPTELVIVLALCSVVVLPIWALVEVANTPETRFHALGESKTAWVVLLAVGLLLCVLPAVLTSARWFLSFRRKVRDVAL